MAIIRVSKKVHLKEGRSQLKVTKKRDVKRAGAEENGRPDPSQSMIMITIITMIGQSPLSREATDLPLADLVQTCSIAFPT